MKTGRARKLESWYLKRNDTKKVKRRRPDKQKPLATVKGDTNLSMYKISKQHKY